MSTSNVCLPLDMGLGTKPEQDCGRFTKYEAEICYLHLSHPSSLLFSIPHPSSLTTTVAPLELRCSQAKSRETEVLWEGKLVPVS